MKKKIVLYLFLLEVVMTSTFLFGAVPETLKFSAKEIEAGSPSRQVGGLAVLEAYKNTVISSEVRSPIVMIHKRLGDHFEKGDVLIELDNRDYSIQFMKAQALHKKNSAVFANKKRLFDKNIVSQAEVIEAEANREVAKADLDLAQLNLENTVILAPYSGEVKKIFLEEGELATNGSELIEIISDEKLVANILFPSAYRGQIKKGSLISIKFDELAEPVEADVVRIGRVIDPASGTFKVEATIDNNDYKLHSGMTGWAIPGGESGKRR